MHFTETLTAFLLCFTQVWTQYMYDCPKGWMTFEENCYEFIYTQENLENAKQKCQADGASLLSINTPSEENYISNWLSNNDLVLQEWYTSGRRDIENSQVLYWEGDGTKITNVINWLSDKEYEKPGSRIVYMNNGESWGWTMKADVEKERPFICEISRAQVYKIVKQVRDSAYGTEYTDPRTTPQGPVFTTEPVDIIYDSGSKEKVASMECVAFGIPQPKYKWYRETGGNLLEIDPMEDRRYTLTNGKLTISPPNKDLDAGTYQCEASNEFGTIVGNKIQLTFGYLQDFSKTLRDPVRVNAYEATGIDCNPPAHYPDVLYSWYKDDIRNFVRPELKPYVFISRSGKLLFQSVTSDDEGQYYCLVYNPSAEDATSPSMGKHSTPIPIIVLETVPSEREPQMESGFPRAFPNAPKRGDTVNIECFARGTGILVYTWRRKDDDMPGNAVISDHGRVLTIPNIQFKDKGEYECTVQRTEGLSTSKTIIVPLDAEPYFTLPIGNKYVDQEGDLDWRCEASSAPDPVYSWYKNGKLLTQDTLPPSERERMTVSYNVLRIKAVDPERDQGMYQCAATNLHGTRFSTGQLQVLSFPPTFDKFPLERNQFGSRGGNVTILCSPEAAPSPVITWLKNNRPLGVSEDEGSRIRQLKAGHLFISNVQDSDRGFYTCVATNVFGESKSTGNLTILTTSVISHKPKDDKVTIGSTATLHCLASVNPLLDLTYVWLHQGKKVNIDGDIWLKLLPDPHYERGEGVNKGDLIILDVQQYHEGIYTCVATTVVGSTSAECDLLVVGPPGEPAGVRGDDIKARSITVRWQKGAENGAPTKGFKVEAYSEQHPYWEVVKTNIPISSKSTANVILGSQGANIIEFEYEAVIDSLNPYTIYKFRVLSENANGWGPPSKPSPEYTTLQALPDKYPRQLGGGGGKVGDLTVTWQPMNTSEYHGQGFGYRVFWRLPGTDEKWEKNDVLGGEHSKFVDTVGSLNYYRQYEVTVAAFNAVGEGPRAPTQIIWSAENMPTYVPVNIHARQYNATALLVSWNPVIDDRKNMKGRLYGFRINYWKAVGEDENIAKRQTINGTVTEGFIIGLLPDTYYWVNVMVFNTAGNGPKSQDFKQDTLRSAPIEAPQEVQVRAINSDSIHVKWRGVQITGKEEPLEGYIVRMWYADENVYSWTDYDSGKDTEYTVYNMKEDTMYELRVLGYSRGGNGTMSSPTIQLVLGKECYIREDKPEATYMYLCTGCSITAPTITIAVLSFFHIAYQVFSKQLHHYIV